MQERVVRGGNLVATLKNVWTVVTTHRDSTSSNVVVDGFGHAKIGWTRANSLVENYSTLIKSSLNSDKHLEICWNVLDWKTIVWILNKQSWVVNCLSGVKSAGGKKKVFQWCYGDTEISANTQWGVKAAIG